MKFIIEMDASEMNRSVESGALIALINAVDDSAKGESKAEKVPPAEVPTQMPQPEPIPAPTPVQTQQPIQTEPQAVAPQPIQPPTPIMPVQTEQPSTSVMPPAPAPAQVPTASAVFTHDQLAVAAMQLKDQGRLAELQGLLSQFSVASMVQLQPEQLSAFATALQGLGVKI